MNQWPTGRELDTHGTNSDAILVVGHGTRSRAGLAEMREATRQLGERQDAPVAACFLELAEPSIPKAIGELYEQGARRLTVVPLLLFSAGHAKQDIPAVLDGARATYPNLETRLTRTLDCHTAIVELSRLRYREAAARTEEIRDEETLLLLVGRGSRCDAATAEMARFARIRAAEEALGKVEVCFAAMAAPSLEQALADVEATAFRRIVVQPHLLFDGQLLDGVRKRIDRARADCPWKSWVLTEHLGPHELLAIALEQLVAAAAAF